MRTVPQHIEPSSLPMVLCIGGTYSLVSNVGLLLPLKAKRYVVSLARTYIIPGIGKNPDSLPLSPEYFISTTSGLRYHMTYLLCGAGSYARTFSGMIPVFHARTSSPTIELDISLLYICLVSGRAAPCINCLSFSMISAISM